jgi:hypothetical protein
MGALAEQYPGQVCPTCDYTYGPEAPGECSNPACEANPTLTEAGRQRLRDMAERYRAEEAARIERQRLYSLSFKARSLT